MGSVCLCCFVVVFLTIADENDWCNVRDRLMGQNAASLGGTTNIGPDGVALAAVPPMAQVIVCFVLFVVNSGC